MFQIGHPSSVALTKTALFSQVEIAWRDRRNNHSRKSQGQTLNPFWHKMVTRDPWRNDDSQWEWDTEFTEQNSFRTSGLPSEKRLLRRAQLNKQPFNFELKKEKKTRENARKQTDVWIFIVQEVPGQWVSVFFCFGLIGHQSRSEIYRDLWLWFEGAKGPNLKIRTCCFGEGQLFFCLRMTPGQLGHLLPKRKKILDWVGRGPAQSPPFLVTTILVKNWAIVLLRFFNVSGKHPHSEVKR